MSNKNEPTYKNDISLDNINASRIMPTITERTEFGIQNFDLYSYLLKYRVIIFNTQVDPQSASDFVAKLLYLQAQNTEDKVTIYINSPGGCVTSLTQIMNAMYICRCPIETVLLGGLAASAAAMMFICGDVRIISPASHLMFHQVSTGAKGTLIDIDIAIKHAKDLQYLLYHIALSRSNRKEIKNIADISKLFERDYYVNATEALKLGFADKILHADNKKRSWFYEACDAAGYDVTSLYNQYNKKTNQNNPIIES